MLIIFLSKTRIILFTLILRIVYVTEFTLAEPT